MHLLSSQPIKAFLLCYCIKLYPVSQIHAFTLSPNHQNQYTNNELNSQVRHLEVRNTPSSSSKLHSSLDPLEPLFNTSGSETKQRKKKLKTFARYLEIESWKRGPEARDLETVLRSIGEACKQINRIVQRAQTDDLYGVAVGTDGNPLDENVQGEVQQKLDVVCNNIMLKQFCGSSKGVIAAVASEEEDLPRTCCDVMVRTEKLNAVK